MFLHNPKAAGTSIRRALFEYDTNEYQLEYQRYFAGIDRVVELFHVPAAELKTVWPRINLKEYFTFGFVRHPYDRLFSAWDEYRRQHPDQVNAEFNEWARKHLTRANVRYDWEFTHFCPQYYFFYEGNKCIADYIGRHENLYRDWRNVCRLAGIEYKELGHEKEHGKYKLPSRLGLSDIAEDVLERIHDIYEMDFILFGYQMPATAEIARGRHLNVIERNTHPWYKYDPCGDVRNLSVPEQCGYWREAAAEQMDRADGYLRQLEELRKKHGI